MPSQLGQRANHIEWTEPAPWLTLRVLAHILSIFPERTNMRGEAVQGYTPEVYSRKYYRGILKKSTFKELSVALSALRVLDEVRRNLWEGVWVKEEWRIDEIVDLSIHFAKDVDEATWI
jgi:hypothetical protein